MLPKQHDFAVLSVEEGWGRWGLNVVTSWTAEEMNEGPAGRGGTLFIEGCNRVQAKNVRETHGITRSSPITAVLRQKL